MGYQKRYNVCYSTGPTLPPAPCRWPGPRGTPARLWPISLRAAATAGKGFRLLSSWARTGIVSNILWTTWLPAASATQLIHNALPSTLQKNPYLGSSDRSAGACYQELEND